MRIHLLSDLHLEHGAYTPELPRADVVVLAGDIDVGLRGLTWAAEQYAGTPVVYVPGNHEYYRHTMPRHTADMTALARKLRVHLLVESGVMLHGMRFLGCTLWTDFELFGTPTDAAMVEADIRRNDYHVIRMAPPHRRLRPSDTIAMHASARSWLERELARAPDVPTVVVTHHAPSALSLGPRFTGDLIAASYASDLTALMERSGPMLWMHGHTHYCTDYTIGPTRVVSNACGYPMAPVDGFRPEYVVDL